MLLCLTQAKKHCVPSFKSFKFYSCSCTSTATDGAHHHDHRLQKGQKHELFNCCCCCSVSLRPSSTVFHLSSHSNFLLALAPAQPLQVPTTTTTGCKRVKSMNFSTAAAAALSHSGQAALFHLSSHSNITLALAPAQPLQVPNTTTTGCKRVKSMNFSTAAAAALSHTGQAALCSIFQVIQILLLLLHQHSYCRCPPPPPQAAKGSKA